MKINKRALLLFTSMSALIFIILFKPSAMLAEKNNSFKTSVVSKSIEKQTSGKERDSDSDSDLPKDPEPESKPDEGTPPDTEKPDTGNNSGEDVTSKPEKPETPEEGKDSNSDQKLPSNPNPNTKPKPETSGPKNEPAKPQNPRPNQNTNNSNSWNNSNRTTGITTPTREPVNTQRNNDIQSINEEQTDLPIEEVESDDINIAEEEPEVDLAQLSLKELIEMMESGEITGEVREDKYFVISKATKEQREVTEQEALELGIIEAEEEEEPTEEIEEDTSEVIVEPAPEAIKSDRTKMPLYVSAVGLATIIIGSLMYFLQSRRNRN